MNIITFDPIRRQFPSILIAFTMSVSFLTMNCGRKGFTIHCSEVLVRGTHPLRFGINVNHIIGSDQYDLNRKKKIRDSLKELGVKAIRWNEGETGDKVIWSVPPFKKPDLHLTHERERTTHTFLDHVDREGKVLKAMELDEAIGICRDLNLELYIIVGIDAIWVEDPSVRAKNTAGRFNTARTIFKQMADYSWAAQGKSARDMIIDGTEALAKYLARHAQDTEVFLEIGNENYLGESLWNPECYSELVNVLASKIKTQNPAVSVGAQLASQEEWTSVSDDGRNWNHVLCEKLNLNLLDFFIVHQYGFEETPNIDASLEVLHKLPETQRKRLYLSLTETGTWHTPVAIKGHRLSRNTLIGSIYQFRWLAHVTLAGKGRIRTPLFWMSRWHLTVLSEDPYRVSHCAIDKHGELLPTGYAVKIWNMYVHNSLVKVSGCKTKGTTLCYASKNLNGSEQLTVWLLNTGNTDQEILLTLDDFTGSTENILYMYHGNGPEDIHPKISREESVAVSENNDHKFFKYTAPSHSITVFLFGKSGL